MRRQTPPRRSGAARLAPDEQTAPQRRCAREQAGEARSTSTAGSSSGIAFPRTVNSMDERETAKGALPAERSRQRGRARRDGAAPTSCRCLPGRNEVAKSPGSGRLELADSLLRPDHPLTARVYVNRVWHWVMGTGWSPRRTTSARLGERPTHPELLDYLATEFVRDGWSTKKLIRRLVLVANVPAVGPRDRGGAGRDPGNRLRHHYPTRRLEAEAIRDSLLAVSGRLDATTLWAADLPAAHGRRRGQAAVCRAARRERSAVDLPTDVDHGAAEVPRRLQPAGPAAPDRPARRDQRAGAGVDPAERSVRVTRWPGTGGSSW